jgi:1-acyl-sn-glycerol-3-phosphate acyltransferase
VILAANHVSFLDPPVLGVGCRRPVIFLAREDLFVLPFWGWVIKYLGVLPLKRESADLRATKEALKKLKAGKVVAIFPEGTRSADGNLQAPQKGVGFLAAQSQAAVVCAYITGTEKALPRHAKSFKPAKIKIYYAPPIRFSPAQGQAKKESYEKISQQIMEGIKELKSQALKA